MMDGVGDGWWALMWVWMTVFWLIALVLIAWFVWRVQTPRRDPSEAVEILRQRLARGEIDIAQYRELGRELGSGSDDELE